MERLEKLMYEKTSNYDVSVEEGTYNVNRRPMAKPDPLGENEEMVERAGYIPVKKQIQNLIASGEKLEEYRKRVYSNEPQSDDVEPDRTARKDYTEMDALDDAKAVGKRLEKQIKEQKKAKEDLDQAERQIAESERRKLQSEKSDKDLETPAKPGDGQ